MKNTKMNFQRTLKSVSAIFIFMLLSSYGWTQVNGVSFTKGTRGQSSFEYEKAIMTNISLKGGVRLYSDNIENNNFKNKGSRLTFELRRYLTGKGKTMNGLYFAPNISIGRHKVSYEKTSNSGVGASLFSVGLSLLTTNSDYLYSPKEKEIVTGDSQVSSKGLGMKLGYQKRWKTITFDTGMNLSKNIVSDAKGMKMSDGQIKEYNEDIHGIEMNLYIGMGVAF